MIIIPKLIEGGLGRLAMNIGMMLMWVVFRRVEMYVLEGRMLLLYSLIL